MQIKEKVFGKINETDVIAITLTNTSGASITAMTYGATLLEWSAPDKDGSFANITIGLDNLDDYMLHRPFYGATIGRVAGRIAQGKFKLNEIDYQLEQNQNGNHLHGGAQGLDTKIWEYRVENNESQASIVFSYSDPAGSNHYPGNLNVEVIYTFTEENEWKINYKATADAPTLFNPTNHVYFNLHGNMKNTILDHELHIAADRFVELDDNTIPTGNKVSVAGTPFDFRQPTFTKQATESDHPQAKAVAGLDHPFILNHSKNKVAARLYEGTSGRCIEMTTTEPVVVVFMHNGPSAFTYNGSAIPAYTGITLETQGYPDSINKNDFGNTVLNPGETYESQTIYKFSVE
ncbi:aldose epimerase family protein [Jeotgalibaca sp. A122]|uniref:aldose epimerase family protein n=1 Tax=Jeotgalibaca sp. A122 TaxID=3457322 RepID=UPI003FD12B3D